MVDVLVESSPIVSTNTLESSEKLDYLPDNIGQPGDITRGTVEIPKPVKKESKYETDTDSDTDSETEQD